MSKLRDIGRNNEDPNKKRAREREESRASFLSKLENIADDLVLCIVWTAIANSGDLELITASHKVARERLIQAAENLRTSEKSAALGEYMSISWDLKHYIHACKEE